MHFTKKESLFFLFLLRYVRAFLFTISTLEILAQEFQQREKNLVLETYCCCQTLWGLALSLLNLQFRHDFFFPSGTSSKNLIVTVCTWVNR